MSQFGRGYDVNQTFVIEPQDNNLPVLSACTVVYTNFIQSCSGDTQIFLGTGVVSINGNLATNSVSATTYYGDGSNLTGIQDIRVTGGSYNQNSGIATFTNNTGGTFNIGGFFTQSDDIYVTGGTYSAGTAVFTNNTGGTFSIFGFSDAQTFTGGTVIGFTEFLNGLSALTVSATTYYGDGSNLTGISTQDTFVTGGTHDKNSGVSTFTNNTGGTFNVSGFFTPSDDIFTTGLTFNNATYDLNIVRNDGNILSTNLAILASDMTITGGTYNPNTGVATFTNNTGGTFTVSGFLTGQTDTYVTGLTFTNNVLTLKQTNNQADINVLINNLSGLTVNGSLSATTYLGLPLDIRVTGGTYSNGVTTFTNNTGGTFSVNGYYTGYTLTNSEIISVLGYTPLSAYTDTFVTGGTYNAGTATFTNNTGGTFSVVGFSTGGGEFSGGTVTGPTIFTNGLSANTFSATTYLGLPIDVYVTGGTYSAGTAVFTNNTGGTFNVVGFSTGGGEFSGGTVNGPTIFTNGLSANTFSATTYLGLPLDITVTGGTYSNGTAIFTNNTGGTFSLSGFSTGYTLTSSEIISALGYTPLSAYTDTFVTGGTYSAGTAVFTNNTGGTFNLSGFVTADTFVTNYVYDDANTFTIRQNNNQPDLNVSINIVTGLTTDYFDFNTGATVTGQEARLTWNDADGTLDLGLKGGNVTLQIGQEEIIRVVNKTGSNLLETDYQVVRVRTTAEGGAQGQRLAVVLAQADTKANHSGVLGLVTENIDNNQEGFIATFGYVRNIDTTGNLQGETWADGDVIWLSETRAGALTNIQPQNHPVQIGYVVYAHQNNGKIFVKVDEGVDELSELHDVNVTGATDGQVLTYSAASQTWVPTTPSTSSTFTGGTVSGETIFTNGLTANTISATTYQNLPLDITITGGTYSSGTTTLTLTNNTGGTVNVTGFTSGSGGGGSITPSQATGAFGITVDGLGGVISSGQKGYVYVPYNGTITGWSIFSETTGSCVIDVWKDTYGNFPPTSGDSIAGTQKPTLTNQVANRDLTLSSWTTTLSIGDVIGFNVEPSPTGVTRVNLIISVTKT